ncbi:sodium/proton antiporter, CPA1 family [Palleronia marisminoris]|uniref:Na(+)/H(+) antiporter ApNhaP n=1 Tax=Palleronia marisminoris TaxID=315423 RepID=A0A1Y5S7T4_9RHOB|nr:cation:proton antiporter [Palleronia marisminoris]SFG67510.1 sodium/proton antiporter, CPA1 family [Palleronia marisminoris]SLN34374.1 Na(+)/H(+) antiporter ApNhaP [Palleronia marisminoris]
MDIVVITAVIASLFLVIGLAEPLAARLRLPYSVILAAIGILIASGAVYFLQTELTDTLNPIAIAILNFPIRSNVFLYVFLPTLLFQATLGMNLRRMLDDAVPIFVLAIVAVVVATFTVGYALFWASSLPLVACLLLGSIISTTDPSAVVGIFRNLSAPRRLSRIIEGESLLNDAAAIALFGQFLAFVRFGEADPSLGDAFSQFPVLLFGGALVGWIMARLAVWVMSWFSQHELAQISISVALPYLGFIAAEQLVGASGVIAVVTAGLTLNLTGPGRLPPQTWTNLREVWNLLAHWSGALIFVLAALLIPRLLEDARPSDVLLLLTVIGAAVFARAVVVGGFMPLLSLMRLSPHIARPYRIAILWGGLRGAVTLALALAVTESAQVVPEVKRLVGILATGFVLFTLIVQGTTLRWVIGRLGLDRLGPIDTALSNQVIAVALQRVREDVAATTENYGLSRDIVRGEAKTFAVRLDDAMTAAEDGAAILDRDRITLGLVALAGAERDMILERFRERAISNRLAEQALANADRLIETTRTGGRIGYRSAARRSLEFGPRFRLAIWLHNRLRLSGLLAQLTADRFELLLGQRLILRDLHRFIDTRIRRIHGRRVAELLHELLERRAEQVEQELDGLRLQYPGYSEELERRLIRRTALRVEEREYDALHDDGLIGQELHNALLQEIQSMRSAVEVRPALDLAVQKADLVLQFPLFAELDDAARRQLSKALLTRYVTAGEVVLRKDEASDRVFFIASGAVETETAGQKHRLGRGEMFGQLSMLSKRPRRTQVRAISPGVVLILDERRFMKLLGRSSALQHAVRESAIKRGIEPEVLGSGPNDFANTA